MENSVISLIILWIAVMLTYLLGDVLRIISGDIVLGEIEGEKYTQGMLLGIAGLMVTPILMVVLTIFLPYGINRWTNIILSAFWFIFNLASLPTYKGRYDKFLLAFSMALNAIIIWMAWTWKL